VRQRVLEHTVEVVEEAAVSHRALEHGPLVRSDRVADAAVVVVVIVVIVVLGAIRVASTRGGSRPSRHIASATIVVAAGVPTARTHRRSVTP
jgi:hypothetical protein